MKREIMKALWIAAFAACLAAAVFNAAGMKRAWKTGAVCSIEDSTGEELALLDALYPELEWTAYAQSAAPTAVSNDLLPARAAQVQELKVLGDPGRIAFFPLASGRLPREGESGVCALDANTAFELFRSTGAEGNRVRVNGSSLRVIGVVDVDQGLLMTAAAQDAPLNRLAANSREDLTVLASALGASLDPFEFSGGEAARAAALLCAVPGFLAAALALFALRKGGKGRRYAGNILIWALLAGAVLTALWCVPIRLLPARWSDLDFYAQQLEAFQARAVRLPEVRDGLIRDGFVRVGVFSCLSCVALFMERKWIKCGKSS